jgi:hypothetical protein
MTLPQYRELAAYWQKFPPIHLLIWKILGYKAGEQRTNDLGGLLAEAARGGVFAGS